ncbi:DNA repair protein RecN [Paramaledivibacter caminithermalis]|jgi:DNA repair protein RecN (Recombination protein N)|uniref:DNA repair protein RecN n=1 Tax=Paramaledivibacter caminithermalis (strain DSM 15212 / CIP 107654 / DViRD3) TaxID=1121301 RepID=A0A1M6JPX4_PARC5|nr:DNA repair protein RecN [Paramaledivibacter caminithermalis]SHJ48779.1 DNA replication and repair protein RecN [Paramaledivibacter caminithermalis DSM 15212]
MLLELNIENFVLIENVNINFTEGFNVLSGETGAGKSIIIDAISLALGGKSSKNYIRTGKKKAVIQIVFAFENEALKKLLDEYGIDCEDNIIILNREIFGTGKSISRINGRIVQLAFAKKVAKMLIDIHGQHEHQSLLYSENHLHMLDLFGNEILFDDLNKVKKIYKEIKDIEDKLQSIDFNDKERERRIDLIKFQIEEIDSCNLKIEEDNTLAKQFNLLKNAEKIYSIIHESHDKISAGLQDNQSILGTLSNILSDFEKISNLDDSIMSLNNELQDIFYRLQDIATDMRIYGENITYDPETLFDVEKRLDTINNLKRKYGNTIEEILEYRDKLYKELVELEDSANRIKTLNEDIKACKEEFLKVSNTLSRKRKKIAKEFEDKMVRELNDLNFRNANFKVNITQNIGKDKNLIFSKYGIDKVEFLISTNPGEPLKQLSKVASGGEISRIMLAMKVILAKIDNISTLIFDEIDTGISGKTANVVGEKIALISKNHQTICITHLPQIAVMADNHLFIEKVVSDNETKTFIKRLNAKDRINEISRLIGGNKITDLTIKNAREMLNMADSVKKSLIS